MQAPEQQPQAEQAQPITIEDISAPAEVERTEGGDEAYREEVATMERAAREAQLDRYKQDTNQRRCFSFLIYGLVVGWLLLVFGVLFCQGLGWFPTPLADGVLMWLVGGSTGSVLGILYLVIKNLFPDSK